MVARASPAEIRLADLAVAVVANHRQRSVRFAISSNSTPSPTESKVVIVVWLRTFRRRLLAASTGGVEGAPDRLIIAGAHAVLNAAFLFAEVWKYVSVA